MRVALLLVAACAKPSPPRLEHHAAPMTDETFVLEAPLFFGAAADPVLWTLERHGHAVTLTLGDETFTGTFEETGGRIAIEVTGAQRTVTLACERRGAQVHVAGAVPEQRGEHPVCSAPRAWQPSDLVRIAALGCLVQRD
ncbi:MAG TPA: hypothetical protein VLT45_11520, partial [Kofleriaceae bacterium]|nr:hypothetical protein [Kofleriaceae bacterium]